MQHQRSIAIVKGCGLGDSELGDWSKRKKKGSGVEINSKSQSTIVVKDIQG